MTFTLKKSPLFLNFLLDFILLKAYIIRNFILVCKLVDFLEEQNVYPLCRKPRINLRLRLQTYDLHITFILCNITSNLLQKPCNFIYIYKYNPFTLNDYFPLAISPNITRLLSFSYTSLSGIITKTHFTPDSTKETPEKSRIDTSLRARALLLYDLLSSLLIRQNKTHLTSNSTPC